MDSTPYPAKDIKAYLKDREEMYDNRALLMSTINDEQKDKFGHVFEELNWQLVGEYYHPAHGTYIYLYIKPLQTKQNVTVLTVDKGAEG